ncbi:unnamed protein product [Moneuplotes crassus]|uniref:Uncharacterized protein n=1 Tax=Euplotes crassus TaxID=5936 RepID=A0AAD1XF62_EUPCR|nr:unnamed protein product [Moneuplotes crassus]
MIQLGLTCGTGFFQDEFSCRACHPSCGTCDSYTACLTCAPEFAINTTTGLCDGSVCETGKFYSKSSQSCVECDRSCLYQCAYQPSCHTCPPGEYFDLDSFLCVSSCDLNTQTAINDPKLGGIPLCRSFEYYVNPLSASTTELGTVMHPYKELNSVFAELFLFHSHSDREITIHLFEDTTNYVREGTYLINIANVRIESYSTEDIQTRKAKIVGIESTSGRAPTLLPSKFILLNSSTIDYTTEISSDSLISSEDKELLLSLGNIIIKLYKTSLILDNLFISTEYASLSLGKAFLNPIQLLEKKVTIQNSVILQEGSFLQTFQQMNLEVFNSEFDLHKSQGGFNLQLSCIQAQSMLPILTNISNTRFYFSEDPSDSLTTNFPPFVQYGGYDVFFSNVTHLFYGNSASNGFNFLLRPDLTCDSTVMEQRTVSLTGIKIGSDPSWSYAPEEMYYGVHISDNPSNPLVSKYVLNSFEFTNIQVNYLELINIQGNGISQCELSDSSFLNMVSKLELFKIDGCQNPTMLNNSFTNITMMQNGLILFEAIDGGVMNSTTLNDVHLLGTGKVNLITFINSGENPLLITNFTFQKGSIHDHKTLLSFTNPTGHTSLTSINITDVSSSQSSSYLKLLSSKTSTLSSLTFTNASTSSDSDTTNILLNLREMSSPSDTNTTINSLTALNCRTKVISIHNTEQLVLIDQYITVNDLVIKDLEYPDPAYLIENSQIFSEGVFKVVYNRIHAENITFGKIHNMIGFAQKVDQFFEINDSIFRNIHNSAIDISVTQKRTGIRTRIKFDNITIEDWYCNYFSLIAIITNVDLHISNSKFVRVTTTYNAAIVWIYSSNTEVIMTDTLFTQNAAITSVLLHLAKPGDVQCIRCNITENFAVSNTVGFLDVGASAQFYDSEITNNHAYTIPVLDISLAEKKSVLNGCRISNNTVLSKEYIRNTLMEQSHFHPQFSSRIKSRDSYFNGKEIFDAVVISLMGEIEISNGTVFSSQARAIKAVDSSVIMNGVKFLDIQTHKDFIVSVQGNFDILNTLDSEVKANGIIYENSQAQFMKSSFCTLNFTGFRANDISEINYLFRIISSRDILMKDSTFKQISPNNTLFDIYKSEISLFENLHISEVSSSAMELSSSKADLFKNLTVSKCDNSILVQNSLIKNWQSSTFQNCGSIETETGGALNVVKSNITLQASYFIQNKAKNGAAIAINCDQNFKCEIILRNSFFESNTAEVQGGGIYYNMNRPVMEGLVFTNNSAPYGNNIASYAYNIIFTTTEKNTMKLNSVGSSIPIGESYEIRLVDYDNQTMNLINTRSVKLQAESSDSKIKVGGINNARIINGVANLSSFNFIAPPGSQNITYNIISSHIDNDKIDLLSNASMNPLKKVDESSFVVDFRYCKPGEYQTKEEQCRECSIKTYSLEWNSTFCDTCMPNAQCQGKDNVEVNLGYWRKSITSNHVAQCLREKSCLGGFSPENDHPVKCEKGYEGFLCTKCSIIEGEKYQPSSNYECLKCPSKVVNAIEFIGLQIFGLFFIYFIIIVNIRKRNENQFSILMRIFTNYTQLIAAILSFNIKFPNLFENVSSQSDRVSSPERTFFSFDCFIESNEIRMFAPSNALFKLILYLILPIILICIVTAGILLYRLVMHFIKPEMTHDLKRYIAISFICIIFIFHPTMTFQSLKVFQCAIVDEGDSRMMMHMDFRCYSRDHLKWIFLVGFPILIIWVIGMPAIAFFILYRKRALLDRPEQQKYLLILYQGLRQDAFYWEFVNTFRKFVILLFNVFLSIYDPYYRILGAIISLIILIRIQERLKPYKNQSNNRIEVIAVFAAVVTLYCTLVFVTDQARLNSVYYGSLILLFIVNIFFLVHWSYLVLCYLNYKHPYFIVFMRIYSFVLCKNGNQFKQEIKNKKLITYQNTKKKRLKKKSRKRIISKAMKKSRVHNACGGRLAFKPPTFSLKKSNRYKENSVIQPIDTSASRVNSTTVMRINPSERIIAKNPHRFKRPRIHSVSERDDE